MCQIIFLGSNEIGRAPSSPTRGISCDRSRWSITGDAQENLLTSQGEHGNPVQQGQAEYWYWDLPRIKAGSGFLRIMTFRPDKNSIEVQTYSPVLDEFLVRPKSNFSLDYAMSGRVELSADATGRGGDWRRPNSTTANLAMLTSTQKRPNVDHAELLLTDLKLR